MSRVPMGSASTGGFPLGERYIRRYGPEFPNQGLGAEMIAEQWGLTRDRLDEFSLMSHQKAGAAIRERRFVDQIVAVDFPEGRMVDTDEGVREDSSLEALAKLKPVFKSDGSVHAGNSSQISDAAAALLLMTSRRARDLGIKPMARIHTAVLAGSDPTIMLTAPIPATQKALARAGLSVDDIGAFEVNEAFAPVPLAWLADTGADEEKLNPNGGAIALGHPLGASGARLMTTLVHHMRDNHIQYGLQTMCEGGGQANATIIELCD
jgi:acetyl-CoA acyltransferase